MAGVLTLPRSEIGECLEYFSGSWDLRQWARVKVRDVIRQLEALGWTLMRTRGSHRQYRHPNKYAVVTVPGKPGDDLPIGTLKNVQKKAGLKLP